MTQVGGGAGRSSLIKQLNKVAYIYQGRLAGSSDAANAYTAVLLGTKIPGKVCRYRLPPESTRIKATFRDLRSGRVSQCIVTKPAKYRIRAERIRYAMQYICITVPEHGERQIVKREENGCT
jgi:hypothetical protein